MVFDAPDRVKAKRLGKISELAVILVDLVIGPPVVGVLHEDRHPDFHP
jgi:hypothetical protein